MELTQKHANEPEALKVIYNSLLILCKVFYSLNFQVSKNSLYSYKSLSHKKVLIF